MLLLIVKLDYYLVLLPYLYTVNVERFAGLRICSFSLMKFTQEYFGGAGAECLLFGIIKERHLYSGAFFLMSYVHLGSCICGFYKYQTIWGAIRLFQRIDNTNDPYAVSVMKGRGCRPCHKYLIRFQGVCHFRTGRYI